MDHVIRTYFEDLEKDEAIKRTALDLIETEEVFICMEIIHISFRGNHIL